MTSLINPFIAPRHAAMVRSRSEQSCSSSSARSIASTWPRMRRTRCRSLFLSLIVCAISCAPLSKIKITYPGRVYPGRLRMTKRIWRPSHLYTFYSTPFTNCTSNVPALGSLISKHYECRLSGVNGSDSELNRNTRFKSPFMCIYEPFIENLLPRVYSNAKNGALAKTLYEHPAAYNQSRRVTRIFIAGVRSSKEVQSPTRAVT